jgi:transcription initiation factor TFIID subunit 11
MPVAQIVAGFTKVFVGEIVEKGKDLPLAIIIPWPKALTDYLPSIIPARIVQARRGENGPLSPDHLREAYRMYQQETGRVGAARPLRGKRLFTR